MRQQRMLLESIINSNLSSGNPHPELDIAPWIPMVGNTTHPFFDNDPVSPMECRDQLAMLCGKRIGEILVWGQGITANPNIGSGTQWQSFVEAYESVYSVYVGSNPTLHKGTSSSGSGLEKERVQDTLRRMNGSTQVEYTVGIDSASDSGTYTTAMDVTFSGMRYPGTYGAVRGNRMRVYIECQVNTGGSADPYCVGKVYVKQGSVWVLLSPKSEDFASTDVRYHCYGMFTPDQYTRRALTFNLDSAYVATDGTMQMRFVHLSVPTTGHSSSSFVSSYDLVQVAPYTVPNDDEVPLGDP